MQVFRKVLAAGHKSEWTEFPNRNNALLEPLRETLDRLGSLLTDLTDPRAKFGVGIVAGAKGLVGEAVGCGIAIFPGVIIQAVKYALASVREGLPREVLVLIGNIEDDAHAKLRDYETLHRNVSQQIRQSIRDLMDPSRLDIIEQYSNPEEPEERDTVFRAFLTDMPAFHAQEYVMEAIRETIARIPGGCARESFGTATLDLGSALRAIKLILERGVSQDFHAKFLAAYYELFHSYRQALAGATRERDALAGAAPSRHWSGYPYGAYDKRPA